MTDTINAAAPAAEVGAAKLTLVRRFEELLERYIVPYAERALPTDALGYTSTRRVQAILVKYKQPLREFFEHTPPTRHRQMRDNQGSMNLAETLFFLNEGGLFDPQRIAAEATRLFTQANLPDDPRRVR